MRPSSSGLLLAVVAAAGCGSSAGQASASGSSGVGTVVYAIDTSGSAVESHKAYFAMAKGDLMKMPLSTTAVVYRFDARPAEVHTGRPPHSEEEAAALLQRLLKHRTEQPGTNLYKLLRLVDGRLADLDGPIAVRVFTDCGTELMTEEERELTRELTKRWSTDERVAELKFVGVRDGFFEGLREIVLIGSEKFSIEGQTGG